MSRIGTTGRCDGEYTTPSETFDALAEAIDARLHESASPKRTEIIASVIAEHRALISRALKAMEWLPIESAPAGIDVLVSYERSADLPEPWPLVIITHRDKDGFWVWQNRAARSYGVKPTHWLPLPTPPSKDEDHGK
jgi:hypothetical protein